MMYINVSTVKINVYNGNRTPQSVEIYLLYTHLSVNNALNIWGMLRHYRSRRGYQTGGTMYPQPYPPMATHLNVCYVTIKYNIIMHFYVNVL